MDENQSGSPGSERWTEEEYAGSARAAGAGGDMSLQIVGFLWSCWVKKWMVFGILAAGILLSVLYALSLPNMYTSTTTLMPPDNSSSNSNLMGLLTAAGSVASVGSAVGLKTPGAVFAGILESRTVQDGLIARLDLARYFKTQNMELARQQLAASTRIDDSVKTGIITIGVTSRDPVMAAKIAQGYVVELNGVVTNNSTSAAHRERVFLEGRLKEIERDLDDSSKVLSSFSAQHKTIDIVSQGRAMVESGLRLEDQMVIARSELAALEQTYSGDNVRVRAAHARIAELQRQMDKQMGSSGVPAPAARDSGYPSVSQLPALGVTYADLERKVRVDQELWEALTRQYESARVQEEKEIPTVRVLDVANVPLQKSAPARTSIVELGAFLSFVAAIVAVFTSSAWEELDDRNPWKQLVAQIRGSIFDALPWLWKIPGMSWGRARYIGSTQQDRSASISSESESAHGR